MSDVPRKNGWQVAEARAQVARLARAYYHADLEVIDETSEHRREWRLALSGPAHASHVANALIRAELTRVGASQSAAALRRAGGRDASRRMRFCICR
jgi:hypothetical protein